MHHCIPLSLSQKIKRRLFAVLPCGLRMSTNTTLRWLSSPQSSPSVSTCIQWASPFFQVVFLYFANLRVSLFKRIIKTSFFLYFYSHVHKKRKPGKLFYRFHIRIFVDWEELDSLSINSTTDYVCWQSHVGSIRFRCVTPKVLPFEPRK